MAKHCIIQLLLSSLQQSLAAEPDVCVHRFHYCGSCSRVQELLAEETTGNLLLSEAFEHWVCRCAGARRELASVEEEAALAHQEENAPTSCLQERRTCAIGNGSCRI